MSAAQLAYRVVKGMRLSDNSIRILLGNEPLIVEIGNQLPVGRLLVCLDKQRCVDYYSGTMALAKDESEFLLTLDYTGLEMGKVASRMNEIEVAMPYLVTAELIDTASLSKLRACPMCPFARSCKAGELGGSSIETYLGQIIGPFFLPCHDVSDYEGNASRLHTCRRQCVGAAVMRANIGAAKYMPEPLLSMPPEHDPNVFTNLDEFVAHHRPELSSADRGSMLAQIELYLYKEFTNANTRKEKV